MPSDLHYTDLMMVYLLLALPIFFYLYFRLAAYRRSKVEAFDVHENLLRRSGFVFWIRATAVMGVWLLATLSVMGPVGNGHYPGMPKQSNPVEAKLKRKRHEVVFLVDASASMKVSDTRSGETRLAYAKDIADEILTHLNGETASLYAFTTQTTQLSPPTLNYFYVRMMLQQLHINEGGVPGTDFAQALGEMHDRYFSNTSPKLTTIILFSDGGDTKLLHLKQKEKAGDENALANLLDGAEAAHVRLFTVGMGSKKGGKIPGFDVDSSLQARFMKKLAERGRGHFYDANEWSSLGIAQNITERMAKDNPFLSEGEMNETLPSEEALVYDHYFQLPLGFAILLLALAFFLPQTRRKA